MTKMGMVTFNSTVCAVLPLSEPMSTELYNSYLEALESIPDSGAYLAAKAVVQTYSRYPKPAQIIKAYKEAGGHMATVGHGLAENKTAWDDEYDGLSREEKRRGHARSKLLAEIMGREGYKGVAEWTSKMAEDELDRRLNNLDNR